MRKEASHEFVSVKRVARRHSHHFPLTYGVVLFATGLTCAIWKARRYRRRGSRELFSEIAHLVFGPSVLLAVLMMIVGLGLLISCLFDYAG